ncbi:hypothetical protein C8R47DRAFT_1326289 [Mycena vitilis]|nr:hypothetical protein C8R47DRAFT_1326289 [Mycena vitilis]
MDERRLRRQPATHDRCTIEYYPKATFGLKSCRTPLKRLDSGLRTGSRYTEVYIPGPTSCRHFFSVFFLALCLQISLRSDWDKQSRRRPPHLDFRRRPYRFAPARMSQGWRRRVWSWRDWLGGESGRDTPIVAIALSHASVSPRISSLPACFSSPPSFSFNPSIDTPSSPLLLLSLVPPGLPPCSRSHPVCLPPSPILALVSPFLVSPFLVSPFLVSPFLVSPSSPPSSFLVRHPSPHPSFIIPLSSRPPPVLPPSSSGILPRIPPSSPLSSLLLSHLRTRLTPLSEPFQSLAVHRATPTTRLAHTVTLQRGSRGRRQGAHGSHAEKGGWRRVDVMRSLCHGTPDMVGDTGAWRLYPYAQTGVLELVLEAGEDPVDAARVLTALETVRERRGGERYPPRVRRWEATCGRGAVLRWREGE